MAYPDTLDSFQSPGTSLDSPAHADLHTELSGAVNRVQVELGLNPAGGAATVADRLADIETYETWATYVPNITDISTGVGSFTTWFVRYNDLVHVHADINFGAGSALGANPRFGLPFAPAFDLVTGTAVFIRFGLAARSGEVYAAGDGWVYFLWEDNASGLWEPPTPSAGADGDQIAVDITYRTTA